MTEIQKKVISHCSDQLNKVETYKVWSDMNEILSATKIDPQTQRNIMATLEKSVETNISIHCKSIKGWLSALLEDAYKIK